MKLLGIAGGFVLAGCMAVPAWGESVLYINFAPDVRYSANGQDSRISFVQGKGLYGFGHDYGKLAPCADDAKNCIAFDFMALLDLPRDAAVGAEYVAGDYKFRVSKKTTLAIAGCQVEAYRVDVSKNGQRSNSYLIDLQRGVLAIITLNFDSKNIPESIFFLQGHAGVFAKPQ